MSVFSQKTAEMSVTLLHRVRRESTPAPELEKAPMRVMNMSSVVGSLAEGSGLCSSMAVTRYGGGPPTKRPQALPTRVHPRQIPPTELDPGKTHVAMVSAAVSPGPIREQSRPMPPSDAVGLTARFRRLSRMQKHAAVATFAFALGLGGTLWIGSALQSAAAQKVPIAAQAQPAMEQQISLEALDSEGLVPAAVSPRSQNDGANSDPEQDSSSRHGDRALAEAARLLSAGHRSRALRAYRELSERGPLAPEVQGLVDILAQEVEG